MIVFMTTLLGGRVFEGTVEQGSRVGPQHRLGPQDTMWNLLHSWSAEMDIPALR